jgi:hypothetical protein
MTFKNYLDDPADFRCGALGKELRKDAFLVVSKTLG